jgi:hypothetical protein
MSRSLRNVVIVCGIVGLSSWVGSCSGGGPGPGPGGDDDRPPIIVSDGSVHLRAVAKDRGPGTNQERGQWKQQGGQWFHDHGGPKAKNLLVNVMNGSGGADCDNPDHDFKVRTMTVTYTNGMVDTPFKVFIENPTTTNPGQLMTDPTTAAVDPNLPFWLTVGTTADHLKSVTFTSLGITCALAPGTGQIHIYQTTKF